jgi:hypothetical protein
MIVCEPLKTCAGRALPYARVESSVWGRAKRTESAFSPNFAI